MFLRERRRVPIVGGSVGGKGAPPARRDLILAADGPREIRPSTSCQQRLQGLPSLGFVEPEVQDSAQRTAPGAALCLKLRYAIQRGLPSERRYVLIPSLLKTNMLLKCSYSLQSLNNDFRQSLNSNLTGPNASSSLHDSFSLS